MKKNLDVVQIANLAGTVLTVAATLITSFANDKKLDKTIEEKVAEALAKQLGNGSSNESAL